MTQPKVCRVMDEEMTKQGFPASQRGPAK